MSQPDAIDQSFSTTDPAAARAAGIKLVSMYLSNTPAKNATADKIRAYHAVGIGVLLNWESSADRAKLGAPAGRVDATTAVGLVRALFSALGYRPKNKLAIPFSADFDSNSTQYPDIDSYFGATKAIVNQAGFVNGAYGEADLIDHLHSANLTAMEWQTYAWSKGRLSPEADLYQYSNGHKIGSASVDYDRIIHPIQVGAWWPPGHMYDVADGTPVKVVALVGGGLVALAALLGISYTSLQSSNPDTPSTAPLTSGQVIVLPPGATVGPSAPVQVIPTPTPAPPVTSVPTPTPAPAASTYQVKTTDSDGLAAAMRRIGISNWQAIASLNGISKPYAIRAGQVLRLTGSVTTQIPVAGGGSCSVTVRYGQTLSGIDPSNWRADAALNGIKSPYVIKPGQVIKLAKCSTSVGKHAAPTRTVTVIRNLSTTAAHYGISLGTLLAYNPSYASHPNVVREGAKLVIPQ